LRLASRAELTGRLQSIFSTRNRDDWIERLTAADVPNSPVYELHDAVRSEQVEHLQSIASVPVRGSAVAVPRSPIRVDQWDEQRLGPPPALGEHTQAVLRSLLGLSEAEIAGLIERRVVAAS
jgi:crotonobetainyl-CoA:carnitine CoA-transferase CaiB-like acyl-CoA transferase